MYRLDVFAQNNYSNVGKLLVFDRNSKLKIYNCFKIMVEFRLLNIICSKFIFDYQFVWKLKQYHLAMFSLLQQSFTCVLFSSARLMCSNFEHLFNHWIFWSNSELFDLSHSIIKVPLYHHQIESYLKSCYCIQIICNKNCYLKLPSSYHAASMDLPDPLLPPISIVHHSWKVFQATSGIGPELLYIGSSWSFCICSSM